MKTNYIDMIIVSIMVLLIFIPKIVAEQGDVGSAIGRTLVPCVIFGFFYVFMQRVIDSLLVFRIFYIVFYLPLFYASVLKSYVAG